MEVINLEHILKFEKIIRDGIFESEFNNLVKHNEIKLNKSKIAILYGANGTGKTSLLKLIEEDDRNNLQYDYNNHINGDNVFFVIKDQIERNVIEGDANELFLGDKIRKQYKLKEEIKIRLRSLAIKIHDEIKETLGITSTKSVILNYLKTINSPLYKLLFNLAKTRGYEESITPIDLKFIVDNYHKVEKSENLDEEKRAFLTRSLNDKHSIIYKILKITLNELEPVPEVQKYEEVNLAVKVLKKYEDRTECIVCDTQNVDLHRVLDKKNKHKSKIIGRLNIEFKEIMDDINEMQEGTPYKIKEQILDILNTGDISDFNQLKLDISNDIDKYINEYHLVLIDYINKSDILKLENEYNLLVQNKFELNDEDFFYLQEVVKESMEKELTIKRDNKDLVISLDKSSLLHVERAKLPLSTGEQNFISLTFELIKANKASEPIIVIDDPISSFDSIYKNKIVYAIAKILREKEVIILTHNTDLLRLVRGQIGNKYRMYIFNNSSGCENGFIELSDSESSLICNIEAFVQLLKDPNSLQVQDQSIYLISLIPFMRGYSGLVSYDIKEKLSQVMHGYKTEYVDIGKIYYDLFLKDDKTNERDSYRIDSQGIIDKFKELLYDGSLNSLQIIRNDEYRLLNRTLVHSFSYLALRLIIEEVLCRKYSVEGRYLQLGKIISCAYNGKSLDAVRERVFLTSKKTLINDFNHFEGNMNIFQPAIDINDDLLKREIDSILKFIDAEDSDKNKVISY